MSTIYYQNFKGKSSSLLVMLAFVCMFLFNQKLTAQPANCDNPGSFQITPPDGAAGDGSSENPFIVCEDQPLQFISDGVSSTLGLPNPGLVFLVYYQQPTDSDPEQEDAMTTTLVAFSDTDGNFIFNNGDGAFISTGLTEFGPPWITDEAPDTICIVPIIVPDINNPGSFDMDCTGIDPSINYPKVVIVDPEIYPSCTLDPIEDCPTQVLTQIGPNTVPTEFCESTVINLTDWESAVTTDADDTVVFTWLDEDGTPLANPTSVSLSTEQCDISSYVFSLQIDCTTDSALNLDGGSVSFTVYPTIEGNFTLPVLEGCDGTISLTCPDFDVQYSVDGGVNFTNVAPVIEAGEALEIVYTTGLDECNETGTYTISCPEAPCAAEAGTPNFDTFSEAYCESLTIAASATGFQSAELFTQNYLVTDVDLNILAFNTDGEFDLEPGTYLIHALNWTFTNDSLLVVGENAGDILAGVDCFDLETSSELIVLTPIGYSLDTECDDSGTATVVFTFSGGLPQYAFENGFPLSDGFFYEVSGFIDGAFTFEDEFITNTLENQLFELEIVDFAGCSLSVMDTIPCSVKSCDANVGTLNVFADSLCTDESIDVSTSGSNDANDFEQFYFLANSDLDISVVSTDGLFDNLDIGNYTLFVLNTDQGIPASDYEGLNITSVDSSLILCFDLAFLGGLNVIDCDTTTVCEAEAGSLVGLEDFYCSDVEILAEITGANLDAIYTQVFVLTDTNLNIIATSFDGTFSADAGSYIVHSLNVLTSEADPLFDDLTGLNAADVLATLNCFDIESSGEVVVLTPIGYTLDTECDDSGTATAVFTFSGGLPQYASENGFTPPDGFFYEVSGFIDGAFTVEDEFITNTMENQLFELEIVDFAGCSLSVMDTIPCSVKSCNANVGTLITVADSVCTDESIDVSLDGSNDTNDFEQFYLLTDEDLNIAVVSTDGLLSNLDIGSYTLFVLNTDQGLPASDYEGLNITAVDSSLVLCFDLAILGGLNVVDCSLDPIVIGPIDYNVDTMSNTYTATFEIMGGSGVYTVSPGNLNGSVFISDTVACGTDLVITITDDAGNSTEIEIEAPCEEDSDCPGLAEGGTLMGAEPFYCSGDLLMVSANGFNDTPDYTQLFVVTQGANFIIQAVAADGDFGALPAGTYEVHTFNFFNDMPPVIPADPIGTSAVDIVTQTDACFDLNPAEAITITVLEPIDVAVDYDCDGATGIYTLTFGFTGGLPSFATANGTGNPDDLFYNLSGDITGMFTLDENNQTQAYLDNTPYQQTVSDNAGCEISLGDTPDACIKTSIELLAFDGVVLERGNRLDWATASETDNDYFSIERSLDGMNFQPISRVESKGNSNFIQNYEWLDMDLRTGFSYYRLASVDVYGKTVYSHIVRLERLETPLTVSTVSPNPTSGNTQLQFYALEGTTSLMVYDVMGKLLIDKTLETNNGLNQYQLESSTWTSGMYWIFLSNGETQVIERLIKE